MKKFLLPAFLLIIYMVLAKLITSRMCFFESTIGLPCPGCGLTRAFENLFLIDFRSAFYYHPLFWAVPIIAGVFILKHIKYGSKKIKWFEKFMQITAIIFIIVYIIRMIIFFPHTEPLVINEKSFLIQTVSFFVNILK